MPKQRIVVFGGKKLHPACFVCAGRCGTCLGDEGASRFHQKDGAPYCHSCFTERFAPRCGVCSRPIEGGTRYIVHKGVKIHQSCFCCVECGVALSNGHYEHDGLVYCAEDYARRFGETCALCSEKLLAWITVPTGESYCRSHQGQAPPCFACGRLVDVAKAKPTTGIDLADGRVSCSECAATAVHTVAEARPLLRAVRAFFAGLGVRGLPHADDLHLCVLERSELLARNGFEASSHRRQRCPLGLTCSMETTTVAPGGASASTRHIDAVCVLRALPKELCASTLAHEVGHVYLHLNDAASPTMAAPLCEGICELFAYLWLTRPSHPQGQQLVVRVRAMMENTDRVYGQGFRDALAAYYACDSSLVRLLSELHRTHRLPTGRLPTGGSPARLARHGGAAVGGGPGEAAGSGAAGGGAAAAKAASPGARAAAGVLVGAPAPPSKPPPHVRSPLIPQHDSPTGGGAGASSSARVAAGGGGGFARALRRAEP